MSTAKVLRLLFSVVLLCICTPSFASEGKAGQVGDAAAALERSQKLYDSGYYEEATQILTGITTADPAMTPQVLKTLGNCYEQREMWQEAVDCYSKLLRRYPDSAAPNKEVKRWMMECYLGKADVERGMVKIQSLLDDYPSGSAEYHYFTGRRQQLEHNFQAALSEYGKAVDLNTAPKDDPIARDSKFRLMDCFLATGKRDKATALLQKMLKEYPEDASTLHLIIGRRFYWNGQFDDAIPQFKEALALNKAPRNAAVTKDIRRRLMLSYARKGRREDALGELRSIITDYPKEASSFILTEQPRWGDKLPDAVAELRRAAEACPRGSSSARYLKKELLNCYKSLGDEEHAFSVAESLVHEFPDEAANYLNLLASRYEREGKHEEAEGEIRKALDLTAGPKTDFTLRLSWQIVEFYTGQAEWKKVISIVQDMLRDYPEDTRALELRLILAYLDDRQYKECIAVCKDIVNRFSDSVACIDALTKLAECMYPLGKGEEAIAFQDDFFRKHPDRTLESDCVRARTAYYAQKDYPKAADLLERFIAGYPTDPYVPEARNLLASSLELSGQTDRAVGAIRQLVSASPKRDRPAMMNRIGDVYFEAKRYKDALKEYKEVRNLKDAPDELKAKAIYQSGLCYRETGYQRSAEQCMELVVKRYPESGWAKRARGQLFVWAKYGGNEPVGQ